MFNAEKMRAYYNKIEKARKLFDEKSIDIICHFMDFYYEGKYDEEQRKKDEEFLSFSAKTMGTLFDIFDEINSPFCTEKYKSDYIRKIVGSIKEAAKNGKDIVYINRGTNLDRRVVSALKKRGFFVNNNVIYWGDKDENS